MISAQSGVHFPSPGACLDDLLASRFLPKHWIARIWSASELPSRLQRCARNLPVGSEWRAYGDEERIFFAIARLHRAEPPDASATAIDAYFLDVNAAVYAAGVWDYSDQSGWWLDAVMEPSFDCDRGWWFEATSDSQRPLPRGKGALPSTGAAVSELCRRRL